MEHTESRRSGPRRWLRAVTWWVRAADLHPQTATTVLRAARNLAARMDYDSGHVLYRLDDTAAGLHVDRATLKRAVRRLREAGLLVWVTHGSRSNIRRAQGLSGYAGTATVYAAVIPACFDAAQGHQVIGRGYNATIVVHHRGNPQVEGLTADIPLDRPAPPSLTVVKEDLQVKVEVGGKDIPRKRASTKTTTPTASSRPARQAREARGERRSPAQVARDCWLAAQVRPRVGWTQGEQLRRLAYALRPLIDAGLDAHGIAAELHSWMLLWRPSRPAAYIHAHLRERAAHSVPDVDTAHPLANQEMRRWLEEREHQGAVIEAMLGARPRTHADRRAARTAGRRDLRRVVQHLHAHGDDDAIDLYGADLTARAARLAASASVVLHTPQW